MGSFISQVTNTFLFADELINFPQLNMIRFVNKSVFMFEEFYIPKNLPFNYSFHRLKSTSNLLENDGEEQ